MSLKKQISFLFAVVATCFPASADTQSKRLGSRDRIQIVQTILKGETYTDSETWRSDAAENTVYLLRENLSVNDLPEIKGIRFVLITQRQIDEMKKTGIEYYRFGNFQLRKSNVRISFTREYLNVQGQHSNGGTTIYTCRRTRRGWRVVPHAGPAYTAESK
jgi:hypothetical protein